MYECVSTDGTSFRSIDAPTHVALLRDAAAPTVASARGSGPGGEANRSSAPATSNTHTNTHERARRADGRVRRADGACRLEGGLSHLARVKIIVDFSFRKVVAPQAPNRAPQPSPTRVPIGLPLQGGGRRRRPTAQLGCASQRGARGGRRADQRASCAVRSAARGIQASARFAAPRRSGADPPPRARADAAADPHLNARLC